MANRKLVYYIDAPLHYHTARARAVYEAGKSKGWDVILYIGQPHYISMPSPSYLDLFGDIPYRILDQQVDTFNDNFLAMSALRNLKQDNPDAVATMGYSCRVDRAMLGWCRNKRRGAILLCESQAIDLPRSKYKESIKKLIVSLYDSSLVGGAPHKDYVMSLGIPPERIFLGLDVVDNKFWAEQSRQVKINSSTWKNKLGLPNNYFISTCRFIPKKNLIGLIQSFKKYVDNTPTEPWHLVLVGTGPLNNSIQNVIQQLSLKDFVHMPGYLDAYGVAPYYALASVFVLASSNYEQWGLVVNEAMASGLPVLVSQICGSAYDLVDEGINGYTFDPNNREQLTNLLIQMQKRELDLPIMGNNSNNRIQCWSPEIHGENLIKAADTAWEHAKIRKLNYWIPAKIWL